jgi:hypothetical protein
MRLNPTTTERLRNYWGSIKPPSLLRSGPIALEAHQCKALKFYVECMITHGDDGFAEYLLRTKDGK